MSSSQTNAPKPLPLPLKIGGSVFAMFHLLAVGMLALGARSGPMNPRFGPVQANGPMFAAKINETVTYSSYLEPLRMTHNYHFQSNRPLVVGAYFEVQLKNEAGIVFKTLKFPDEKARSAVRHRQEILAQALTADAPPMPRGTQKIGPAGAAPQRIEVWEPDKEGVLHAKMVDESEAQERQMLRPAPGPKLFAQSYVRYLCRQHKAASAVLSRYSQQQAIPSFLIEREPLPAVLFAVTKSDFGEFPRD